MLRYPLAILALAAIWLFGSDYAVILGLVVGLTALPAIGLSLLMGYTGQISLGHAAFYGLGAYGSALASIHLGLSPWLTIPIAALLTGVVGLALGTMIFRLRGHHLAMATLAFGIIVHIVFVEWHGVTGGPNGLGGVPPLSLFGRDLFLDHDLYPIVWAVCLLVVLASENLVRAPFGFAMRAVAASDRVAGSLGIDAPAIKRRVLALGAFLAGLGGGLYGHYLGYLSPDPFSVVFSVKLLVMVAVGGFATIWGVLFGVAAVTLISELLRPLGYFDVILFGVLLVGVMVLCPGGLLAGLRDLAIALWRRRAPAG